MSNNIKTKITLTDPLGSELILLEFANQAGKVIRVTGKDGEIAGIYMDDEQLVRLQRCLNAMFPVKPPKTKKFRRATRIRTACQENSQMFDRILQSVCRKMELMPEAVLSGRKFRDLTAAKAITGYLVRKHARISYPDLAELFNEKAHASALLRQRRYLKQGFAREYKGRRLEQIAEAVELELELGKIKEKQTG